MSYQHNLLALALTIFTLFAFALSFPAPSPQPGPIGYQAITDLHNKIDHFLEDNKIALVSATYCPYAEEVKDRLDGISADYSVFEVDVQRSSDGSEIDEEYSREHFQVKSGERTVPQLFKDGVFLGQSDFVGTLSDKQLKSVLGVQ